MTGSKILPGVNRRAIKELLGLVRANADIEFVIKVSLMEIYNENIFDLLSSDQSGKLTIHQANDGSTYVPGLTVKEIKTEGDIEHLMAVGDANRSTAATAMNSASSRSHAIMQIYVQGFNRISKVGRSGLMLRFVCLGRGDWEDLVTCVTFCRCIGTLWDNLHVFDILFFAVRLVLRR